MAKTNEVKQIESIEKQIEKLKEEKKSLEEKYTFTGLYKKFAGRHNVLRDLKDNAELNDVEKFDKAISILQSVIDQYSE